MCIVNSAISHNYVRVMWMQLCRPTIRLTVRGHKPEKCCVLSHHFNNKTNVLPIFQEYNLLTDTFFINKNVAKIKKNVKKRVKTFFTSMMWPAFTSIYGCLDLVVVESTGQTGRQTDRQTDSMQYVMQFPGAHYDVSNIQCHLS